MLCVHTCKSGEQRAEHTREQRAETLHLHVCRDGGGGCLCRGLLLELLLRRAGGSLDTKIGWC
jgi:hypothetical protein